MLSSGMSIQKSSKKDTMKQNVRGPLVLQSPFSYNIEIYMYKYIKNIFYFIVPSLDNFYTNMPVLT